MTFLFLLLLGTSLEAQRHTWSGRLAVGSTTYEVAGSSREDADGAIHLSLEVRTADGSRVRSLLAVLHEGLSDAVIDGVRYPLEPSVKSAWRNQLRNGFGSQLSPEQFTCHDEIDRRVCDSRTLVKINNSLAGRVRMIYNRGQIRSIRFFSLAEWTNPFREYVSLSLDMR